MKAILVSLGLIIVTSLASRITPTHADDFKEGEHWYFLHRVNDWDIKDTATAYLCSTSIQELTPKWEIAAKFQPYVAEAKRRGLTEVQCARLTGRFINLK